MRNINKRARSASVILNNAGIRKKAQQTAVILQGESIYKTVKRVLNIEPTKDYLKKVMDLNGIVNEKTIRPNTQIKLPPLPAQPNKSMKPSANLLSFIMKHEGLRLRQYKDTAGNLTIGYGHKLNGSKPNLVLTEKSARDLLIKDILYSADYVMHNVRAKLTQYQFDALTSLVFNVGRTAFASSDLKKLIDAGKMAEAARIMINFRVPNEGVRSRREAEQVLFSGGTYT